MLITHKLAEARGGADRVTVLRRGGVVLSGAASDYHEAALAAAMLGSHRSPPPVHAAGEVPAPGRVLVSARAIDVAR